MTGGVPDAQAGEKALAAVRVGRDAPLMPDLITPRLRVHPIDPAEGERIRARHRGPGDTWADDFPADGDVAGVSAYLRATAQLGEQQPFGYYRVTRSADGLAIGGAGFKGQPRGGRVEIGYGLSPSARGQGYAAEVVVALMSVAAAHALSTVFAQTTDDNIASQRTLIRAGFHPVAAVGELRCYEAVLTPEGSWVPAADAPSSPPDGRATGR